MDEPQTLTISLYDSSEYVEMPLREAVQWLENMLNAVPEEFRDNAWFDVSLNYGICDDPTSLDFQVYYNRLETTAEVSARIAEDRARKEEHRKYEIARLRSNLAALEANKGK